MIFLGWEVGAKMLQQIKVLDWLLEVDVDKTLQFYSDLPRVSEPDSCGCLDCRNFASASENFEKTILDIFSKLGIDASKCSHLESFRQTPNGAHLYGGTYPIVGNVLKGTVCSPYDWNEKILLRSITLLLASQKTLCLFQRVSLHQLSN
jgi:hypothetical protein